ncbi:MAG: hypothetical protein INH41_28775 [Myxococcaceae bacterium]|nr:hypothetical protein [Myxococcaceae bacterium]MCA3016397.1 hypothetical protein [Myxococcaceae bacterium]
MRWFRSLTRGVGGPEDLATELMEHLTGGASLGEALERVLPRVGAEAVRTGLAAEDGPVALVCVDLLHSLGVQLQAGADRLDQVDEPWAFWTAQRLRDMAAALDEDFVRTHLVNAVLTEAGVTSELIPVEVRRLSRRRLEARVVEVLLRMRSSVFTPADLAQTASTLGTSARASQRLADA